MTTPYRLPITNNDDGTWGDILRQYLMQQHYDDGTDNKGVNGGHQNITIRPGGTAAGTEQLKFLSGGSKLTTPEAGAMEYVSADNALYFTPNATTPVQTKMVMEDPGTPSSGDLLYRDTTTGNFKQLGIGGNGTVLASTGSAPSWSALNRSQVPETAQLVSTSETISTAYSSVHYVGGTSATLTLPALSGTPNGWSVFILNASAVTITLAPTDVNTIYFEGGWLGSMTIVSGGAIFATAFPGVPSWGAMNVSPDADKLSTAHNIQTNLASTSASSFDGTTDITPGVTGTLGAGNGGTGLASPGTSGNVLTSTGSGWVSAAPTGGSGSSGITSTVTSSTTYTMTSSSTPEQVFTGSTAQTVTLPSASVTAGEQWMITNQSSALVTVNAYGGSTVLTLAAGTSGVFSAAVATPSALTDWDVGYGAVAVTSGKIANILNSLTLLGIDGKSLTLDNSLTLAGTDGTTMTFPSASDTVVGTAATQTLASKTLTGPVLSAGSTTVAPLKFTSGTNLTTAAAGTMEYDGTVFYQTPTASTRNVINGEQFCLLTANYTLTSTTSGQKLFNASTNGAVTLAVGTYFFDCNFEIASMSATSGALWWGLTAGTATISHIFWSSSGIKNTPPSAAYLAGEAGVSVFTQVVAATTGTQAYVQIMGKVTITAAGTVIPQIELGVAAAASVLQGSYFRIWPVGSPSVTTVGNWS